MHIKSVPIIFAYFSSVSSIPLQRLHTKFVLKNMSKYVNLKVKVTKVALDFQYRPYFTLKSPFLKFCFLVPRDPINEFLYLTLFPIVSCTNKTRIGHFPTLCIAEFFWQIFEQITSSHPLCLVRQVFCKPSFHMINVCLRQFIFFAYATYFHFNSRPFS